MNHADVVGEDSAAYQPPDDGGGYQRHRNCHQWAGSSYTSSHFVSHSECKFVRNGSEYSGPRARAHLEQKLNHLEGRNMVNSAEDFIDLAATKSSMSGRAYEVRCSGGVEPASTWLKRELQRQRQLH